MICIFTLAESVNMLQLYSNTNINPGLQGK